MIEATPILTFDIDWAPDAAIDLIARRLLRAGVRSTWFVTHGSDAVDRLRERPDLFELGPHPNFLSGTSHGRSPHEIINNLKMLVPGARVVRTHSLFSSSQFLVQLIERDEIRVDSSLYLRHANPAPVTEFWSQGKCIHRVPIVWEDDLEAMHPKPIWSLEQIARGRTAPFVLAFHPIHLATNDPSPETYSRIKAAHPNISQMTAEDLETYRKPGDGPAAVLETAITFLSSHGGSFTLSQFVEHVQRS